MENYEHFEKVNIQLLLVLLHLPSDNTMVPSHLVLATDISTDSPYSVSIALHRKHLLLCIGHTPELCSSLSNLHWWKVTFKVPSSPKYFNILWLNAAIACWELEALWPRGGRGWLCHGCAFPWGQHHSDTCVSPIYLCPDMSPLGFNFEKLVEHPWSIS